MRPARGGPDHHDVGRNVPIDGRRSAPSSPARARGGPGHDQMVVSLESIPKPIVPAERERLEAAAKRLPLRP